MTTGTVVIKVAESCVPLVRTPDSVSESLIDLLGGLSEKETFIDLGCGEGDLLVSVAKQTGAKCIGMDVQPEYIDTARNLAKKELLQDKVEIVYQDFMNLTISNKYLQQATALYMYLLPEVLQTLLPLIREMIQKGIKVVSFYHHLGTLEGGIKPVREHLFGMVRMYCIESVLPPFKKWAFEEDGEEEAQPTAETGAVKQTIDISECDTMVAATKRFALRTEIAINTEVTIFDELD